MGLYEPEKEKRRVQEIRDMRKAVRHEKARRKKEKREKYKKLYKEELAKHRAKLQAQKEKDIEVYRTKLAIEKAQRKARARVKPFTPRSGLKVPSKAQLRKMGVTSVKVSKQTGRLLFRTAKYGWSTMEKMFGDTPSPRKRTYKRKTTKRKGKRKSPQKKGKTYYCRKCRKRHSYSSKIGRKHR